MVKQRISGKFDYYSYVRGFNSLKYAFTHDEVQ